ncbi:4'-phosphopantetheinyl transferase family protein [Luteibaculum oceani]|uniref:4'-phosphopantetheinyl transferase superfamily protein n=1 Tax=Luteibaculum oceani TaxID=1294296 RepID=A0A5C6VDZ0_9FLAO|nr:4'-phosphopantetheinyl transferase superfamily protein [Luteibaculum oceani]TXC81945.1 4'-phosphopantetheinyl transferase superfamily protein [Luteibaculum oceani]
MIFKHAFNRDKWSDQETNSRLTALPLEIKQKALRYKKWQDRQACIISRELLQASLQEFYGNNDDYLARVQVDRFGKPFLNEEINFSISHTEELVVCAVAKDVIGVDVEKIREVEFIDFQQFFTTQEWNEIQCSEEPKHTFYRKWTIKEAVLKADGRGLSVPLNKVAISNHSANLDGKFFHVETRFLSEDHLCAVAYQS